MSMDKGSELIVDLILAKDPGQITEEDKVYLVARRAYVSKEDLERLVPDYKDRIPAEEGGNLDTSAEASAPASDAPAPADPAPAPAKPIASMNKEELMAEAARQGVAVPDGSTNAQIKALLKK